jgi:iron(III) transport system permease protein
MESTQAPRHSPKPRVAWLPSAGLGLLLAYLVLVPLAMMVLSSFRPGGFPLDPGFTFDHYLEVYGDPELLKLVWTTVVFGVGATVLAVAMGVGVAWLIERTDLPGRSVFRVLIILPMAMPPMLLTIAWAMILSPRNGALNLWLMDTFHLQSAPFDIYSLTGMVFVQGLALVPTTYLFLAPAFRNMDPSLEEAAMASGAGFLLLIRRVLLPILWPSILSATIFVLIVSLVMFDVPGTLGIPVRIYVLSTRLYDLISDSPTGVPLYGSVGAMAMMFLVALLLLASAYRYATRQAQRYRTITGKAFRPRMFALGKAKSLAVAGITVYFLFAVLVPMAMLVWTSLMPYQTRITAEALKLITLSNHLDFFRNAKVLSATGHSLTIAVVAASAVALLALVTSWLVVRLKVPGYRTLDALAFLPVSMPGVMIGVALIYVYLALGAVFPIYGTIWIIVVAYVTHYLSFGSRVVNGVMMQLHPELEEAAKTSGAGNAYILRRIILPLVWPAVAGVWIWVLAHSLRELSSALMLQGNNNEVVPTLLWDYWSGGDPNRTAAVGVWLTVTLMVFSALWWVVNRRNQLSKAS